MRGLDDLALVVFGTGSRAHGYSLEFAYTTKRVPLQSGQGRKCVKNLGHPKASLG